MVRLIVAMTFVMGLLGGAVARADVEKEAKISFEEGNRLFQSENYDEALKAFQRAYKLRPTWKLLFNIAQTQAAAKHYGLAIESFAAYLADAGDEISIERQDEVRTEMQRLRDMVGMVDVKTTRGATILIDGIKRGVAPVYGGIPVAAGKEHRVEVIIDGETLPAVTLKVLARQTVPVSISESGDSVVANATPTVISEEAQSDISKPGDDEADKTAASKEPTAPESPDANVRKLKRGGIVLTIVGAAAIAAGGITGAIAISKNTELNNNCISSTECDSKYESTEHSRNTLGMVSTVGFIAGGVSALTGVVLLAIAKKKRNEQLTVIPRVVPNEVSLQLGVIF